MSVQKQCPKCGEKNPAEAVMCWACYTSLSGGVAAAGALAAPGAAPMSDSGEKKKVEPKQLVIIGVALVVLLGLGAKMMIGGGDAPPDVLSMETGKPKATTPPPAPISPTTNIETPSTTAFAQQPSQPTGAIAPARFPYQMLGAPNPTSQTATVAIVPTENDLSEGQAKGLAVFAHHQLNKIKKWPAVEVFVFNDVPAAQSFANYQNRLRGAAMTDSNYTSPELAALWPKALVRYYSRNERVWITSPRTNAGNFWKNGG